MFKRKNIIKLSALLLFSVIGLQGMESAREKLTLMDKKFIAQNIGSAKAMMKHYKDKGLEKVYIDELKKIIKIKPSTKAYIKDLCAHKDIALYGLEILKKLFSTTTTTTTSTSSTSRGTSGCVFISTEKNKEEPNNKLTVDDLETGEYPVSKPKSKKRVSEMTEKERKEYADKLAGWNTEKMEWEYEQRISRGEKSDQDLKKEKDKIKKNDQDDEGAVGFAIAMSKGGDSLLKAYSGDAMKLAQEAMRVAKKQGRLQAQLRSRKKNVKKRKKREAKKKKAQEEEREEKEKAKLVKASKEKRRQAREMAMAIEKALEARTPHSDSQERIKPFFPTATPTVTTTTTPSTQPQPSVATSSATTLDRDIKVLKKEVGNHEYLNYLRSISHKKSFMGQEVTLLVSALLEDNDLSTIQQRMKNFKRKEFAGKDKDKFLTKFEELEALIKKQEAFSKEEEKKVQKEKRQKNAELDKALKIAIDDVDLDKVKELLQGGYRNNVTYYLKASLAKVLEIARIEIYNVYDKNSIKKEPECEVFYALFDIAIELLKHPEIDFTKKIRVNGDFVHPIDQVKDIFTNCYDLLEGKISTTINIIEERFPDSGAVLIKFEKFLVKEEKEKKLKKIDDEPKVGPPAWDSDTSVSRWTTPEVSFESEGEYSEDDEAFLIKPKLTKRSKRKISSEDEGGIPGWDTPEVSFESEDEYSKDDSGGEEVFFDELKLVLKKECDCKYATPIGDAIEKFDFHQVKTLLGTGVDVNACLQRDCHDKKKHKKNALRVTPLVKVLEQINTELLKKRDHKESCNKEIDACLNIAIELIKHPNMNYCKDSKCLYYPIIKAAYLVKMSHYGNEEQKKKIKEIMAMLIEGHKKHSLSYGTLKRIILVGYYDIAQRLLKDKGITVSRAVLKEYKNIISKKRENFEGFKEIDYESGVTRENESLIKNLDFCAKRCGDKKGAVLKEKLCSIE